MLKIDSCGGVCPTQADGTFDGNPFYFRARHGDWTLDVVAPGHDPVMPLAEETLFSASGDDESEGYMDPDDVQRLLLHYYNCWFGQP